MPTDPWVPLGNTAMLAGAAYILVAAALSLMFATVPSPVWLRLLQVALAGSVFGIGLLTLIAGWTGRAVDSSWMWVMVPWMLSVLIVPTIVVQLILDERADEVMPAAAWCMWCAVLALANPILEQVFGPMLVGFVSHDTAPWNGAVSGGLFVLAGLTVLGGLAWTAARGRSPAQR